MRHLGPEVLSSLVDEYPSSEEAAHLAVCAACTEQLEELRAQRAALASLPSPPPVAEDWTRLEVRLERAALIGDLGSVSRDRKRVSAEPSDPSLVSGSGAFRSPLSAWWTRVAAALALLLGGGLGGSLLTVRTMEARDGAVLLMDDGAIAMVAATEGTTWEGLTVEEAEALVRATEGWHAAALRLFDERASGNGAAPSADPVGRLVTLQTLVMATEAAIREAPADPFLNGMHASAVAERRAQLERISYVND